MGIANKSQWGHNLELKYTYEKEYVEQPVRNIKMTKEEFDKYIRDLELKNQWKNRGIR